MNPSSAGQIYRYAKGQLEAIERSVVQEAPLALEVNGRELATLVASPHRLNFLVAGFLRLQGFIHSLDDLQTLGICAEQGQARVRIRGEVPERLKPTLTSGCGTGITFELPNAKPSAICSSASFSPSQIFALMRELAAQADNYRSHGGIHSAAVGDGQSLLLFAEDLGRHNTLDRIAGEALFRGIDLAGKMLVTSGRISTEMVAKAARLGIALIASRTSPTALAVRMAEAAGITLIGYLRGESFELFCHPHRLALAGSRIAGITGVILAGGESRRMGCDKSLLPVDGARFIDHIYRRMASLFDEVLVVTNSPGLYQDIPCRKVPDIYYAKGSLAGIHSGLCHARNDQVFVVACDMPLLSTAVIRQLATSAPAAEVVIARNDQGVEPLHARYAKSCLPAIEAVLDRGSRRIVDFFPAVQVHELSAVEFLPLDPECLSFRNINTPQEYYTLREQGGQPHEPAAWQQADAERCSG
jgi:FdhD protein